MRRVLLCKELHREEGRAFKTLNRHEEGKEMSMSIAQLLRLEGDEDHEGMQANGIVQGKQRISGKENKESFMAEAKQLK